MNNYIIKGLEKPITKYKDMLEMFLFNMRNCVPVNIYEIINMMERRHLEITLKEGE